MIDEEWLRNLNFKGMQGCRIKGLVGIGAEKVSLGAIAPDGKQLVIQTYRHLLGYHIREIPLLLSEIPLYDLNTLNRKLKQQVGRTDFDENTSEWDRVFSSLMRWLFTIFEKVQSPREMAMTITTFGGSVTPFCPEALLFAVTTPFVRRRFEEIATLPSPSSDFPWPRVNGPNFPIEESHELLIRWAETMLAAIDILKPIAPLEPDTLPKNPAFIWGGAVMDSFFTDQELPKAVEFIEAEFGRIPKSDRAGVVMEQMCAMASLLVRFLDRSEIDRLMQLCALLGLLFDVQDKNGEVVASSMDALTGRSRGSRGTEPPQKDSSPPPPTEGNAITRMLGKWFGR